jgi:hypothetical protein
MSDKKEHPPSASSDPKSQLAAASRKDGILAVNPKGDLVRLRPGSVRLAASVDKGTYLEGLKEGWRLASDADLKDKASADKARPPRDGGPSPKKSGA